jgi:hypothetical protein
MKVIIALQITDCAKIELFLHQNLHQITSKNRLLTSKF